MPAGVLGHPMIPRLAGAMSSETAKPAAADAQQPSTNAHAEQPGGGLRAHSFGDAMGSVVGATPSNQVWAAPIGLLPLGGRGGQRPQTQKLGSTGHSLLQLWAASSQQRHQNAPMLPPAAAPLPLTQPRAHLPSSSEPSSRDLSKAGALLPRSLASSTEAATRFSAPALLDSGSAALRGAQQPREELAPVSSSELAPVFSGTSSAQEAGAMGRLGPSLVMQGAERAHQGILQLPSASEGQACLRPASAAAWEGGLLQRNRGDALGQYALRGVAHTTAQFGPQAMSSLRQQSGLVPSTAPHQSFKRSPAALQGLPFKIQRTTSGADSACAASASSSPEVGSQSQRKASALSPSASREQAVKDSWARATSGVAAMISDGAPTAPLAPLAAGSSQCQQPNRGAWGGLGASLGLNQQLLDALQLKIAASSERGTPRTAQEGQGHVHPRPSESQASLGSLNTGAILALCRARKDCGTHPAVASGAAGSRYGPKESALRQEQGPVAHAAQPSQAAGSSGLLQAAAAPRLQPEASWSEQAIPEAVAPPARSSTPGSMPPVGQLQSPAGASPPSWDCKLLDGTRSREDGTGFSQAQAHHYMGTEPLQEMGVAWEDENHWHAMDEEAGGDEALRGPHGVADKSRIATERQRRQRIRDGLEMLRSTVNGQGDNAAMLRQAVDYIQSLRAEVGQLQARVNRAKADKE